MKEKGITLIALIVTIIILIILAGITIGVLIGDEGLIGNANDAKEQTEIANEKEIVDRATINAMGNNPRGNIVEDELQNELDKITNVGDTDVEDNGDEFEILFINTKRYYTINNQGDIVGEGEFIKDSSPGILTGDGTKDNPYVITSIEDLVVFSNMTNNTGIKLNEDGTTEKITEQDSFTDKYVILENTLNFNSNLSYVDNARKDFGDINNDGVVESLKQELITGTGFIPINNFNGYFNGDNHEIKNIYINRDSTAGLFVGTNKYIKSIENIGITGNITSVQSVAVGICECSNLVNNCWNKSNITSSGGNVAGVCRSSPVIKGCYNTGNVITTGEECVAGGITTYQNGISTVSIENCYNKGNITGTFYTGGISGGHGNMTTKVINCYNEGNISGNSSVGGILGTNGESIENCYNLGNVTGNSYAGGIVGSTSKLINNCHNEGNIKGNYSGGLAGSCLTRKNNKFI